MFRRKGFTLVELLVVIAIIGILIALLLPAVQAAREAARRSQCTNNLKQMALAAQNFHDTYKEFPAASHQKAFNQATASSGQRHAWDRWSYIVTLLPFMEQQPLYDEFITNHLGKTAPWDGNKLTRTQVATIVCPSDGNGTGLRADALKRTSYHCNRGDYWLNWDWWECRGVMGNGDRKIHSFASIKDGSSNTMLISECVIGADGGSQRVKEGIAVNVGYTNGGPPSVCSSREGAGGMLTGNVQTTNGWFVGWRWGDAHSIYTQWHPILPPNSPTCANNHAEDWALVTASSYHPGGCNVAFCDGSVQFISETIDAGDPTKTVFDSPYPPPAGNPQSYSGPSMWGLWGALGSSSGGESVTVP
jgi:prepilin-type N-terminal cleavage/methylation domain-containing protein/prepilin-type processing-associated H-X9-DG protein